MRAVVVRSTLARPLARSLARSRAALAVLLALATAAAPLAAQSRAPRRARPAPQHATVELTPYAGYMRFGSYADGPFGTDLGNHNGYLLGAQLGLHLTPQVAIVGNLARASADLEVGVPVLGGIDVGSSNVWLYDAGLQISAPRLGAGGVGVSPFLQLGVGGARHELRNGILKADATNAAFNAGLGADLMMSRNVGVRLLARDYIGRFDAQEATGFDLGGDVRHNIALSAGLVLAF
ncbi:MAG TPA: outer membrane beta-barrel protein [Gemmatimonadaceae bacterium]|nr:outer membrane beta-barrel protein [Gemmatimonadaceae bacterium]